MSLVWSFRNYSNVLICCSRNISSYYQCENTLCCLIFLKNYYFFWYSLMKRKVQNKSFFVKGIFCNITNVFKCDQMCPSCNCNIYYITIMRTTLGTTKTIYIYITAIKIWVMPQFTKTIKAKKLKIILTFFFIPVLILGWNTSLTCLRNY